MTSISADDLALLSHTNDQMQDKTSTIAANSAHLGLSIHKGKSNILRVSAVDVGRWNMREEVEQFIYQGSTVSTNHPQTLEENPWKGPLKGKGRGDNHQAPGAKM